MSHFFIVLFALSWSAMADRKAELERKKAKLQALREEKMRKQKEREQQEVSGAYKIPFIALTFKTNNSPALAVGEFSQGSAWRD